MDVHDYEEVFFHVCANVDPKRDLLLSEGPLDQLDHSAVAFCLGGKLGIDATHKTNEEGGRDWPDRIEMTEEVRSLVSNRWSEYGIDGVEAPKTEGFPRTCAESYVFDTQHGKQGESVRASRVENRMRRGA